MKIRARRLRDVRIESMELNRLVHVSKALLSSSKYYRKNRSIAMIKFEDGSWLL